MTINDSTKSHPLRPVYGPNDTRWAALAAWLEENFDERTGLINDLSPSERGHWHEVHIVGGDHLEVSRRGFDFPAFPVTARPVWASRGDIAGLSVIDQHPTKIWWHPLIDSDGVRVEAVREDTYDPDKAEINEGTIVMSVTVGSNETITISTAGAARDAARALMAAADVFDEWARLPDGMQS